MDEADALLGSYMKEYDSTFGWGNNFIGASGYPSPVRRVSDSSLFIGPLT